MATNWTSEQKKVIELHNRNILVSAAAGSGKTAVLVERIIKMITREEKPIDIDRLVVVTFTKMAAYEMRMRIMDAIEKRLAEEPDNKHLRRQLTLIHGAKITTIDSFCLDIVRGYFNEVDLDPSFRVADEGELKLLSGEVMEELLENYYQEGTEAFFDFVDSFAPQKTDEKIEEYILKLYRFSQSYPWPKEWLMECSKMYDAKDIQEFANSKIAKFLFGYAKNVVLSMAQEADYALELINHPEGSKAYFEVVQEECETFYTWMEIENYDELQRVIKNYSFAKLPAKKEPEVDKERKETTKKIRDNYKKMHEMLKKDILELSMEDMYYQSKQSSNHAKMLIRLTMDYIERMDDKKREKKIITFSDMEHIALDILVKKEDGQYVYQRAADELANRFEEILIDEYQDSNWVQELILKSISRERFGSNNVFMVGDVKQSIYKFRLARPELFIDKYNRYTTQESACQKIELHKNFRSRESVLNSVNSVFFNIMTKEFGGIAYDENAMLNLGAEFPTDGFVAGKTEICLLNEDEIEDYTKQEAEAILIADKIVKLVSGEDGRQIYDKKAGVYRNPQPGDIVILLRGLKDWAEVFVEVLKEHGVMAYSESSSGYFDAVEVRTLLCMLAVIDNPRQDIPLAAALKSYFGNFDTNELAEIRAKNSEVVLYDSLKNSRSKKTEAFLSLLGEYRGYARYMEISRLIWKLVYDTGYYDYLGSMPAGHLRQENINMLIDKARQYEKSSYKGLFHFLKYIDKLKNYEVDFAGATDSDENSKMVQIMSIHKSKGLEFPIVILAGMDKKFNESDAKDDIIFEADYGIGLNLIDTKRHVKKKTVQRKAIIKKILLDNLAEEERILYVAMTRAKEHLIMVGSVGKLENAMLRWRIAANKSSKSFMDLAKQANYFDMVMPVALEDEKNFWIHSYGAEELFEFCNTKMENLLEEKSVESEELLVYQYPHKIYDIPVKMSVSEIKHMGMDTDNEGAEHIREQEEEEIIPNFIAEVKEVHPATRGSAYHGLLEHLDYSNCDSIEGIRTQKESLCKCNLIPKEWAALIDERDILQYTKSKVGREAKNAFEKGCLYREKQFMTGICANEIFKDIDTDERIVVQGVIDMYYETDEGIVLVDYKTDRVTRNSAGEEELKRRYTEQLIQYKKAIEMILEKKVVKIWIYSFALGREIEIVNE